MDIDLIGDPGDAGTVIIIGTIDPLGIMPTGDQITGITTTPTGILMEMSTTIITITITEEETTTILPAPEDTALQDHQWEQEILTTEIEQTLIHTITREELQAIDLQEQ